MAGAALHNPFKIGRDPMDISLKDSDIRIATGALNRILTFNHNLSWQRDRLPESGMLFHYTTAEGLKGIVEKNELARMVLDPS